MIERGSSNLGPRPAADETELAVDERVRALVRQLVEAEAALVALIGGVDSVIDPATVTPFLLRQAQADLTASEERYNRLVAAMSAIVFELTPEGRVLFVNDAITQVTGYRPDELVGQAWDEILLSGDLRWQSAELARRLREGDVVRYEVVIAAKDASQVVLELNSANHYLPAGALERIVGIANDITERKRAEQAQARHAAHLEMLNEVQQAILAAQSKEEIARAALQHVRRLYACDRASVLLYDFPRQRALVLAANADGAAGLARGQAFALTDLQIPAGHSDGQPHVVQDLAYAHLGESVAEALLAQGFRSHLSLPLIVEGQLIGSLNLAARQPASFDRAAAEGLRPIASLLAVAIQNARMYQDVQESRRQLQAYSRRLTDAVENERRSIARELHDQAGQLLTSLMLGLGVLEKHYGHSAGGADHIAYLQQIGDELSQCMHRIAVSLRPASLDRLGLVPALRQLTEVFQNQSHLSLTLQTMGVTGRRLDPVLETAIYRIVQEALTNILRHAGAANVGVLVQLQGDQLTVIVEDDGAGFDVQAAMRGDRLGLLGMQERAEMLGGTLTIESAPGKGSTVYVQIPAGARAA